MILKECVVCFPLLYGALPLSYKECSLVGIEPTTPRLQMQEKLLLVEKMRLVLSTLIRCSTTELHRKEAMVGIEPTTSGLKGKRNCC